MSLSLENYNKKGEPIAYLLKDNKIKNYIYYIDEDDLPEDEKILKSIKRFFKFINYLKE